VIQPLLEHFGIIKDNLGYFVLDNASNNDTILVKLSKTIRFELMQKRLRYIGYIFNLIAKLYIFGQDISTFKEDYKKALLGERREL
jgi:hypothetical protein